MAVIETEGLEKHYGDVRAVDGLDLRVEAGEVFGFLGPNGAGKSTTIDVLLGFLSPTAGSVRVLGADVTTDSLAVRRRTGLLPEGYEPYPNLTGREHVVSAIETKGADDDPDALLERVGLAPEAARRPAGGYSTGMGQRLSLAVALVGEPDLLVLDEPSAGLDPDGVALLREIIREEAARGATVFFSSHILEEVEKVCDRVGILDAGRMVATDTVANLREELGAGATVSLPLAEAPAEPLLEELAALAGVREVSVADGRTVVVDVADRGTKLPVIRRVDEAATVRDVRVEEASLEALFEEYTGGAGPTGTAEPATADGGARR